MGHGKQNRTLAIPLQQLQLHHTWVSWLQNDEMGRRLQYKRYDRYDEAPLSHGLDARHTYALAE